MNFIEFLINVTSLASHPDIQCDPIRLDSSAPLTRRVTSASCRQFLRNRNGSHVAFVNSVPSAKLTLIREDFCDSITST